MRKPEKSICSRPSNESNRDPVRRRTVNRKQNSSARGERETVRGKVVCREKSSDPAERCKRTSMQEQRTRNLNPETCKRERSEQVQCTAERETVQNPAVQQAEDRKIYAVAA